MTSDTKEELKDLLEDACYFTIQKVEKDINDLLPNPTVEFSRFSYITLVSCMLLQEALRELSKEAGEDLLLYPNTIPSLMKKLGGHMEVLTGGVADDYVGYQLDYIVGNEHSKQKAH